ncbi:MAG: tripartite tricarboxylate transporter permease, partial [Candidatus Ratteibacteria bacterium]
IDVTTGYPRFSFGNINLVSGISFIPAMIGLFGLSEVLFQISKKQDFSSPTIEKITKIPLIEAFKISVKNIFTFIKSSLIGVFIGALPGAGADIAAWVSYGVAKRTSKNSDKFGTGFEEGVIAPTTANNAALGGTWIPAFIFGVPGDTITAIVLGAMLMYGLKPGPRIFIESGDLMRSIFAIGIISHFFLFIFGYLAIKASSFLLKLPKNIVLVAILVFCIIGSYSINNNFFDVYVMIFFGVMGFFLEKIDVPLAPIILGIILGPMVENNLRVGLIQSEGKLSPFFTRPICLVIIVIIILTLFGGNIISFLNKLSRSKK